MPPRTGPRRRKRAKPSPPPAALRLAIIRTDETTDLVLAYRIELDTGHLVLRDGSDAIIQIIASGEWREIRPAVLGDLSESRAVDSAIVTRGADEPEETDEVAREQMIEALERAIPHPREEPDERIWMELERRLRSSTEVIRGEGLDQDPPDTAPAGSAPPAAPRKD